jgi:hypothetical protein
MRSTPAHKAVDVANNSVHENSNARHHIVEIHSYPIHELYGTWDIMSRK